MMRNLVEVINQILDVLDNWVGFFECKVKLRRILEKIKYKALETIVEEKWWNEVEEILINTFVPLKENVDYQIMSIWTNRKLSKDKEGKRK